MALLSGFIYSHLLFFQPLFFLMDKISLYKLINSLKFIMFKKLLHVPLIFLISYVQSDDNVTYDIEKG